MKLIFKERGLYLSLVLLALFGCKFEPFEEYEVEITPPQPISVTFTVDEPALKDPYYLMQSTQFFIRLGGLENRMVAGEIKQGHHLIPSGVSNMAVMFTLDPAKLGNGTHTLDMVLYASTNSGSLADRVGEEYYVINQTFTVVVDSTPPTFRSFRAGMENGYLTLRWDRNHPRENFIYKVKRSYSDTWFHQDTLLGSSKENHYIDPGYVGGKMNFQVIAQGFGFEVVVGSGEISMAPADFVLRRDSEGIARLRWSASALNPQGLQMGWTSGHQGRPTSWTSFTGAGDIAVDETDMDPSNIYVYVDIFRRGYYAQRVQTDLMLTPNGNIHPFKAYAMMKEGHKLIIATDKKLYRYNLDGFVLEDSLSLEEKGITPPLSMVIQPDESRAYVSGDRGQILSFNPLQMQEGTLFSLETATQGASLPSAALAATTLGNASNSGLLTVAFWKGKPFSMVVNLEKLQVLWQYTGANAYPPAISEDGNFIAAEITTGESKQMGMVYKRNLDEYRSFGTIDPGKHAFLPTGREVLSYPRLGEYTGERGVVYARVYNLQRAPQDASKSLEELRNNQFANPTPRGIDYDLASNTISIRYQFLTFTMNAATLEYENTVNGPLLIISNNHALRSYGHIEAIP